MKFDAATRLPDEQLAASSPDQHAALSASAGTGKTHVLTSRVLRLLLAGVEPAGILCLTFTKAGAAEMADRIHRRLASWVRLDRNELRRELFALGASHDEDGIARARTLFARVLDAPGGLRIQTIHSFAQALLASFPAEAGLTPGFRAVEGREEQILVRTTLAELVVQAEEGGTTDLIRDISQLSLRLGESGAEAFLTRCARHADAMDALGPSEGIEPRLRRAFELPDGDIEEEILARCCDTSFDVEGLRRIAAMQTAWGTATGLKYASACEKWLAASPAERAGLLAELHEVWATKDGTLRAKGPKDEAYAGLAQTAFDCCAELLRLRKLSQLVDLFAAALRAGQRFAEAYAHAKRVRGLLDFDDLIRHAERLLAMPGMGDWVRYKLDQRIDHILVDEAQDTNRAQWSIVSALAEEFFAGEGARDEDGPNGALRTLFLVGDFKQAIFGFQGTDPRNFDESRRRFAAAAEAVERPFLDLAMNRSFRSSPPVLQVVDQLLDDLGPDALGLPHPPEPHASAHQRRPGAVTLWEPVPAESAASEEGGEEGWISEPVRLHAGRIADQVKEWLDTPLAIGWGDKRRALRPQDVLILCRRRSELAALIVARLHANQVPVAGIDRLLLSDPLAVQDLLAAARFAIQPLDDLNLASLLVSPLFGWSQEALLAIAHRRKGRLWPRLRELAEQGAEPARSAHEALVSILGMADYASPHGFFETLLSREMQGRRKLLGRLGREARDPIEELLTSALEFEQLVSPSLEHFLDWFSRGKVEIVRDPSAPLDAVRVMTVHGSKGLQAPLVILADATADPNQRGGGAVETVEFELPGGPAVPLPRPRKDELAEPLASQLARQQERELQEHWRLLYVALTRAEERVYVAGALTTKSRNGAPQGSWHKAVEHSLQQMPDCREEADPRWGHRLCFGDAEERAQAIPAPGAPLPSLPAWLRTPAPAEERPPRPLAPSLPRADDSADPPPAAGMRAAARRGRILHQLFERVPATPRPDRRRLAEDWLLHAAGIADEAERRALLDDAMAVIEAPAHAEIFGPDALAEAPLAAAIPGGDVVMGTVDRLLVRDDHVHVIDFKTARSVPAGLDAIPAAHVRQMAAYAAALEAIFAGRRVRASLLYTGGPKLFELPPPLLAAALATGG